MGIANLRRQPRIVLALLMVAAFMVGMQAWWSEHERGSFYQSEFAPAVSLACGQGFRNVYSEKEGVIASFTHRKVDTISCDDAFSAKNNPSLGEPNILQHSTISLQYLYGILWRSFGIDWEVTALITGALLAMTTLAAYLFTHQLLGAWPSLAVAALVALAADPLGPVLVHLRDFSKAPFVILLASLFVTILFTPRRRLVPLAALAALVTAIGTGFRSDVSLFLVLLPIAFLLRIIDRQSWRHALAGLGVFIAVAVAYDWFILTYSTGIGRNNPHVVILGHASQFIRALGFADDHQGAFYWYKDPVAHGVVSLYAASASLPEPGYATPEYDRMGRAYLMDILRDFPANELLMGFTAVYKSLFNFIGRTDIILLAIFLVSATIIVLRFHMRGLAVLGIAILLGGLMGIQFHPRHFFHLQVLGLVLFLAPAFVLVTDLAGRLSGRFVVIAGPVSRLKNILVPEARESRRVFGYAVLTLLALFTVALMLARPYQERRVATIVDQVERFPKVALPLLPGSEGVPSEEVRVFNGTPIEKSAYLAVTQEPADRCPHFPRVDVAYASDTPYYRYSFSLLTPSGEITGAYFPAVVVRGWNRVESIKVSGIDSGCRVNAAIVHPESKFLPLVYFSGRVSRPSYHQSRVFDDLSATLNWLRRD